MKIKLKYVVTALVIIVLGIIAYSFIPTSNKDKKEFKNVSMDYGKLDEIIFNVKTSKVIEGDLIEKISANGTVKADKELDVVSNIKGIIEKINIYEGKYVNKNDLLIKLDDREQVIAVKEAQDKLIEAKVEYGFLTKEAPSDTIKNKKAERIENEIILLEKKFKDGNISESEYNKRKNDLDMKLIFTGAKRNDLILNKSGYSRAINMFDRAKLNLSYTEIKAPFSGVIGDFNLVVGQHITANSKLFKLFDIYNLRLYVNVLEDEIDKIKVGNIVSIKINAIPGKEYFGKVIFVSPYVNPDTKTGTVVIRIKNKDKRIKPGMYANANIEVKRLHNRILIPKEALLVRDKRNLVFTVEDSLAKWKYVDIGEQNDKYIEILKGVNAGDNVIVKGQFNLAHDAKVKVRN